jgi:hypothetical protein
MSGRPVAHFSFPKKNYILSETKLHTLAHNSPPSEAGAGGGGRDLVGARNQRKQGVISGRGLSSKARGGQDEEASLWMASGAVGGLRPGVGGGDEAGTTEEGCVVRDATGGLRPGRAAGGK